MSLLAGAGGGGGSSGPVPQSLVAEHSGLPGHLTKGFKRHHTPPRWRCMLGSDHRLWPQEKQPSTLHWANNQGGGGIEMSETTVLLNYLWAFFIYLIFFTAGRNLTLTDP